MNLSSGGAVGRAGLPDVSRTAKITHSLFDSVKGERIAEMFSTRHNFQTSTGAVLHEDNLFSW